MVTRLSPAARVMASPTSALPVKLILRTRASAQIASPSSPPGPVTQAMASSGNPASSNSSTSFSAESGVSLAGLRSTALPPAMAGPILCATRLSGKLKGVIAATMPHGTRRVNPSLPTPPGVASNGTVSPCKSRAASADKSRVSIARPASMRPSANTLPSSRLIRRARSSCSSAMSWAVRRRISTRRWVGNARITAAPCSRQSKAAVISAGTPTGTVSSTAPS